MGAGSGSYAHHTPGYAGGGGGGNTVDKVVEVCGHEIGLKCIFLYRSKDGGLPNQVYVADVDKENRTAIVRFLSPNCNPTKNVTINLDDIVSVVSVDAQGVELEDVEKVTSPISALGLIQRHKSKQHSKEE